MCRSHIKVIRTDLDMMTIHCDDQLVRTSSLRGEGDGVGTIPMVLHLSGADGGFWRGGGST